MNLTRSQYYENLKKLARELRDEFDLHTPRVLLSDLRRIYKEVGIDRIDLWANFKPGIRGAYFCDELGAHVVLNKNLPEEPRIFTMCHELKHHLVDGEQGIAYCASANVNTAIEIGAEVFGAELMFPEQMFAEAMHSMGVEEGCCKAEHLVQLKHSTRTTLSYAGLVKRAEFLGFSEDGALANVKWRKLEESMYGEPLYKQINRYRARRRVTVK